MRGDDHDIARNIQLRMTLLGVQVSDVAAILGVTKQALYPRLRRRPVPDDLLVKLSLALVVPLEALTARSPSLVVSAPVPTRCDWRVIVADEIDAGSSISIDDLITLTTASEEVA